MAMVAVMIDGPPPGIVDRPALAERLGIDVESITRYISRGDAPKPDGMMGGRPWWFEATVAVWIAQRPGRWGNDRKKRTSTQPKGSKE